MDDQFDFDVGLDELQQEQTTKRKYTRHSTATPAPVSIYISNNTDYEGSKQDIDIIAVSSAKDLNAPLNETELHFIQLHLIERMGMDEAMISVGYGRFSKNWRYILARRIIIKYESRASDRRILARTMGAGEVAIIGGLLEIAQGTGPIAVRRAAYADLASILGLKQEQIENFQGVTLNVYSQAEAERLGIKTKPPASSGSLEPQHIQITK